MTIEHALEICLVAIPALIFVALMHSCHAKKGRLPAEDKGGRLACHSFEGITAIALIGPMAFIPDLAV